MDSTPPEPPQLLDRHKILWWVFWFVFLSTPVFAVLMPSALRLTPLSGFIPVGLMGFASAVAGAFAAGFILAKLTSKTSREFIRRGIAYGFSLSLVCVLVTFAGCSILVMSS